MDLRLEKVPVLYVKVGERVTGDLLQTKYQVTLKRKTLGEIVGAQLPSSSFPLIYFLISPKLLEKEMATHSSILAWRIAWTEQPGGLKSMDSQRVGHN